MLPGHLVLGVGIDIWASLSGLGKSKKRQMMKNWFFQLAPESGHKNMIFPSFFNFPSPESLEYLHPRMVTPAHYFPLVMTNSKRGRGGVRNPGNLDDVILGWSLTISGWGGRLGWILVGFQGLRRVPECFLCLRHPHALRQCTCTVRLVVPTYVSPVDKIVSMT